MELAYPFAVGSLALLLWLQPQLRRATLLGGLFTFPLIGVSALLGGSWSTFFTQPVTLLQQSLTAFVLGCLASGIYHLTVRRFLTPTPHPARPTLWSCLVGTVVTFGMILTGIEPALALLTGITANFVLMYLRWRILTWDFLSASLAMGTWYVLLAFLVSIEVPARLAHTPISHHLIGVTLFALPLEEVVAIFLLGSLLGPLYLAAKSKDELRPLPFATEQLRWKRLATATTFCIAILGATLLTHYLVAEPQVVAASPTHNQQNVPLTGEVRLEFDRPVDRQRVQVTVTPKVPGSWRFENSLLDRALFRTLIFTPDRYLSPGTTYTVRVEEIANVLGRNGGTYEASFHTQGAPALAAISLQEAQASVPVCEPINVSLSEPNLSLAEFEFSLEPPHELEVRLAEDSRSYSLHPRDCLQQDTEYLLRIRRSLTVYRPDGSLLLQETPEEVASRHFRTKPAPGVNRFSPNGSTLIPAEIQELSLAFDQDMNTSLPPSGLVSEPPISGTWQWKASRTLILALSEPLAFATTYTIAVPPGLQDAQGGHNEQEYRFSFSTLGYPHIARITPRDGSSAIAVTTPLRITFDQAVDHTAAEQAVSITPAATGRFSWEGTTLIYQADWQRDTHYRVSIRSGIPNPYSLTTQNTTNASFQTEESRTILSVPLDYQDQSLSCEVASLKMALAFKGIHVEESTLLSTIPFDATPRQDGTWGDPDVAFVGSISGKQNSTGYGVHWAPIASSGSRFRPTKAFSGWSLADLAREVAAGNPIIMWGVYPGGTPDPWTTPSDKRVNAWKGEHVRVVIGFTGSVESPSRIIMNDPVSGRLTWTASQFRSNWATFNNSGVVVY